MNKQESYGLPNLFVYCKDTCEPRGLYYAKNEVDKVIDDMMAEDRTDNSDVIARLLEERRWRKFPYEKPKWGEEVLVVDDESKQYIVRFSHDMKWISWGKMNTCESNCVKYWMPLPSSPKEY